ncbi:MAG: class I SAM-dependent methyltransferase [Ignavibacteriales bacterium]|nr:class I SAM-dependent methyltransferase [Ignavibacteriales bacterium]
MHERRFHGEIERLRTPQRLALLEVERVVDLCLEGIQATNVLDVGTGSGIFAEAFSKRGMNVTGIDPNPEMLKAAKDFVPAGKFQQGTIEEIPFKDKSVDLVFLGHVLHESDNIVKALSESKRVAKQKVCVLEWPYKQEESGPPLEHRLKSEEILTAVKQAGFSSVETIQLLHMVLFRLII